MPSIRRSTKIAERTVLVLRRYIIKVDHNDLRKGDVILVVRNDQGKEYTVTLRRNKQHGCTCPSYKPCYHIKAMVKAENERWDAEKVAKKAEEVKVVEECKAVEVSREQVKNIAIDKAVIAPKHKNIMLNASLNGNRAFSLMR